ncbi:MAG TPA: 4Fe-4S binding protein, partial [Synergistales bacterium]|nr:4Fe-4S binding protein [Synergistales bacterium]
MTGGQSHPGIGDKLRKGETGRRVDLESAVKGCGVNWVKTTEAYDISTSRTLVKEAWDYARTHEEPAVVIFRHPCMLLRQKQAVIPVTVDPEKCIGCKFCINFFNCPGLVFDEKSKKAYIDERFCVKCGVCINVCPHGAILATEGEEA